MGLNEQLAEEFRSVGFEVPNRGLLITSVDNNSPADNAGLKGATRAVSTQYGQVELGGDVILSINGNAINGGEDLIAYLETNTSPGDIVDVTVSRNMEELNIQVVLGERP